MTKLRTFTVVAFAALALLSGSYGYAADEAPSTSNASAGGYAKKFQFTLAAGLDLAAPSDFKGDWHHESGQSPVGQFSFQWNFFQERPFNLIVGGMLGAWKSVETLATSEATTSGYSIGPMIGVGFNPGRASGRWRFEAIIAPLIATKHTRLKSPGFTMDIASEHSSLEIGGNLLAQFSVSEEFRIVGGIIGVDSDAFAFGGGVAYAY